MSGNKGRVAIFFWDGWISVSPSITNTMLVLVKNGYDVDCITRYPNYDFAEEIKFPPGINIYRFGKPFRAQERKVVQTQAAAKPSLPFRIKSLLGLENVKIDFTPNKKLLKEFRDYIRFAKQITKGHDYDLVIGVDTYGLASAGIAFLNRKTPLLYFSLEIKFLPDLQYITERYIKRLEKFFHRRADFTIIQDKYRLKSIMDENRVKPDPEKIIIVPNSSIGNYTGPKSRYFRDMFALAEDDVIVLHAGGISRGYMNEEIATTAATWPEKWKLIFHFSAFMPEDQADIEELKKLSNNRALFSFKPVPFDKLPEITSSADMGIVFYSREKGPNFSLIVGASGKLANYLKSGLPVIAMSLPGFKELFDEYGCGVTVDTPEETPQAIETILKNYDSYRKNASRCYEEVYEFESHFNPLFPRLKAIKN